MIAFDEHVIALAFSVALNAALAWIVLRNRGRIVALERRVGELSAGCPCVALQQTQVAVHEALARVRVLEMAMSVMARAASEPPAEDVQQ